MEKSIVLNLAETLVYMIKKELDNMDDVVK